jgi:GTP cyclohydrolase I
VGKDPDREGLLNTLKRYTKAILFFIKGYKEDLRAIVNGVIFHKDYNKIVIAKDIKFFSLYKHYLMLFFKKVN